MKASELMIGDWVSSPKLRSHGGGDYLHQLERIDLGCEYDPIPITKGILKANGWSVPDNFEVFSSQYETEGGWICVTFDRIHKGLYVRIGKDGSCVPLPTYVHELQHALRVMGLCEMAENFKIK